MRVKAAKHITGKQSTIAREFNLMGDVIRSYFGLAVRLHAGPDHIRRDFWLSANMDIEARTQVVIALLNGGRWFTLVKKYR